MRFIGNTQEYLHLDTIDDSQCHILKEVIESSLSILWFESNNNELIIDGVRHTFKAGQIIFLTEFHKVEVIKVGRIRFLRFNRPFYCILDHDAEVGCKGVLFFGASKLPIIAIPEAEFEKFDTLWKMFVLEMESNDNLQIDMLQMMLKRYLILCTRLYKQQADFPEQVQDADLVREFNFLVEQHFKTKHTVAEYADLLNKSPKTLSNLFAKEGGKTPLQYIQSRRLLEARRLLHYSDLQIQEVAYEIGFDDLQTFSRFFKKQQGASPSTYRKELEKNK